MMNEENQRIDEETVEHIAKLAKLEFEGEAKKEMQQDLNRMLDFVDKLNELDTEDISPLVYMSDEYQELRTDEVQDAVSQEIALKNAPKKDSDYIKVPRVLKK